ncbi:Hydroxymethylglutaryl-CoA lyase YngG [compost metagenome]
MADAEAVIAALSKRPDVRTIGLVLNERGAGRALATSVDELGVVVAASDVFGTANQGLDVDASIAMAGRVIEQARAVGRDAQVTISVAFGCPLSGPVDPALVADMARRLAIFGPLEIALADTIGVARPDEVSRLVAATVEAVRPLPVRVHFHDTRGTGVANAVAAVAAGAVTVDASIGGTGGCPFAPGAAGNVATEDVAYALNGLMAVDIDAVCEAAVWLNEKLQRSRTSAMTRAWQSARERKQA